MYANRKSNNGTLKILPFVTLTNSLDMCKKIYLFDAVVISQRLGFLSCVSDMGVKYVFPNMYLLVRPDHVRFDQKGKLEPGPVCLMDLP